MDEFNLFLVDTSAWQLLVRVSFYISLTMTTLGIIFLPGDIWAKGYMMMGLLWCIYSAFGYAKAVRDAHEVKRSLNQAEEHAAERVLKDFN